MVDRPEIVITTDLASTDNLHDVQGPSSQPHHAVDARTHRRTPSDPTLLSPGLKVDVPSSPSLSDDGTIVNVPPSPTLSNRSSVHWHPTTTDLRSNQPEATSGMGTLSLLEAPSRHRRSGSVASTAHTVADVGEPVGLAPLKSRGGESDAYTLHNTPGPSKQKGGDEPTKDGAQADEAREGAEARGKLDLAQDEAIDIGPFMFKPFHLASLVDPKSLDTLTDMGGVTGLLDGLGTHRTRGLGGGASEGHRIEGDMPGIVVTDPKGDAGVGVPEVTKDPLDGAAHTAGLEERRRVYGENVLPTRASKSLLALMWLALKDKVLVLLSVAAVVSLALGLFQDFGTPREPGEPPVDWVEGVAIMVAIMIVVLVGSLNDWQKERQFKVLNEKKDERGVKVIRDGVEQIIDIKAVVVGDVALLEPGEIVPCDGVFLSGHNVKCDESGATGESDAIKKVSYEDCLEIIRRNREKDGPEATTGHTDCFMISGSKILEGYGSYVVIAVGTKSFNGRIMMALRGDTENTPLQLKLNALAELIAKLGTAAGLLLFTALMIRFFVQLGTGDPVRTASQKGIAFVNILIISVTLIVVAVPEGLPLAVTLALAFATKRMTYEKLLVRVLGSCETMANASVVCTDKTGTLTQNEMTVVAGSIGIHGKFVRKLSENEARTNANEERGVSPSAERRHVEDFSLDQADLNKYLSPELQTLFNAAIAVNSTAFEDADPDTGERVFVGSKTETALLSFAKELGWGDWKVTREGAQILQMVPFSSERKAMGVVVRLPDGRARIYLKGASEVLAKKCTRHIVVGRPEEGVAPTGGINTEAIDEVASDNISRTIIFYANQTLRTIALCYRDFEQWPPVDSEVTKDGQNEVAYDDISSDLTLIAITGIEDPLRPGVTEAVAKCHRAGVTVKMCTGDNVLTARSIALQCGIYTPGGIIMEGPIFRQLTDNEMLEVVPRLQVLARSSPEDKKILVSKLRDLGEIVGVTGDGTNDGPALKAANVGFSMGIAGTEVAKEASDIILMDDNFSSIVKAIIWGRCVNDSVRKFLQFQLAVNITAVIITFVSAVASAKEESVLSAVQLLWVNIIMDTFAALALATDPATEKSLERKPERLNAPLFSIDMYKQIFGQAIFQTTITLVFHFLGYSVLGLKEHNHHNDLLVQSLAFNTFVFSQIFNSFNCRRLDQKLNVFEGMTKNWYFMGVTALEIGAQILIVFVGGAAFTVTKLGGREWGMSIGIGFASIPIGAFIRLLPNGPFTRLFIKLRILPNPEVLPTATTTTTKPDGEWNYAINTVRDNLGMFSNVRGGRMRASSFVGKSRKSRLDAGEERVALPSLMTMVPTLIASSVGAGWAPQPGSLSDPARSDPSKSTAALWEGKIQVHPDTKPDDFAFQKWGKPS